MLNRDHLGYFALAALTLALAVGVYYFVFAPHILRVAVPYVRGEPAQLFIALSSAFRREHAHVRLIVQPFDTNEAAVEAFERRQVDLAVVQADRKMPQNALGVAQVHETIALVLVRQESEINSFADLKGKRVGELTRSRPGQGVFNELLTFHRLSSNDLSLQAILSPNALQQRIVEKNLDAIFFAPPRGARMIGDILRSIAQGFGSPVRVLSLKESNAISARLAALDTVEIEAGELSGEPPVPAETVRTLSFPMLLVAQRQLSNSVVEEFTRQLFYVRSSLISVQPAAARLSALDTDRGATFAVHPGAAVYYDASESSWLERYSDVLWLALFGFSTIVSAFVWFLRRLFPGRRESVHYDHEELIKLLAQARATYSPAALDELEDRLDLIVAHISRMSFEGKIEEGQQPALKLLVERVEKVIGDQRRRSAA